MSIMKKQRKFISFLMIAAMLLAIPVTPAFAAKLPDAKYTPVQLEAVPMKEVTYYKAGSASIPELEWVTDADALDFLPGAVMDDVTSVVKDADGVYWIGTENGLQRVNFKEKNVKDIVQYLAGPLTV